MRAALLLFACTLTAHAQWQLLDAHTTADLRGIDNVGNGIAWASGSNGTVLRTEDNGKTWQHCTTPPDAEKLDFRGIQGLLDKQTAIVMSSGKGELSRLYETTDGCQTWKLVFTNPDKDGFWDAVRFVAGDEVVILGDSVSNAQTLWEWDPDGDKPPHQMAGVGRADDGESSFAASNSTLELPVFPAHDASSKFDIRWTTSTAHGSLMHLHPHQCACSSPQVKRVAVPVRSGTATSGIFSFEFRNWSVGVAVGGDFQKPLFGVQSAAYSRDGGLMWVRAQSPPHGYRSAVAYDATTKTWITVGPNGTDISTDDGRNWRALKPGAGDAPDADKNWNALSLPFVVGPKGRIGMLEPQALKGK